MSAYPLVRKGLSSLLGPCVYLLVMALFLVREPPALGVQSSSGIGGLLPYLWPLFIFLSPVGLSVIGAMGGIIPLFACLAIALSGAYVLGASFTAVGLCAVYLLPFVAVHVACLSLEVSFWRMAALHILALALGQTAALLWIKALVGGNLFLGSADKLIALLEGQPLYDTLLLYAADMGLISLPLDASPALALDGIYWPPEIRRELGNSLRTYLETRLYTLYPDLLIRNSLLAGLLGTAAPIATLGPYGRDDFDMPPFSQWHIPRGQGKFVALLAAGLLFPFFIPGQAMAMAGAAMWTAASTVLAIQGAAMVDHLQEQKSTAKPTRRLLLVAVYAVVPMVLVIAGVMDQFTNVRGLRPPVEREDEEQ